jgi:hypothetical protein
MTIGRWLGALCVVAAVAGCGGSTTGGVDAGALPDVGSLADMGALVDTGPDGGAVDDAGSIADAGGGTDAAGDVGSILPGIDAGDPFGDAGALGDPPWVPIEVRTSGTCTDFTPCGGDVVGTWDVSGGCVELPIGDTVRTCPGASITRAAGQARGRVSFDGAIAHRVAQSIVDVQIVVPAICASFVGGCSGLEAQLRMQAPDSACTMAASGACTCEARQTTSIDDTDAYTTTATEIVGTVSGKRWAYCVAGDALTYRDTSASGPREPGVIRLTRR